MSITNLNYLCNFQELKKSKYFIPGTHHRVPPAGWLVFGVTCVLSSDRPLLGHLVAQMIKNLPQCGRPGFDPWVGKIPWRRKWQPPPVFLPGESPWTEEPGGLQSVGSQRVGHNWSDSASTPNCALVTLCLPTLLYFSPSPHPSLVGFHTLLLIRLLSVSPSVTWAPRLITHDSIPAACSSNWHIRSIQIIF